MRSPCILYLKNDALEREIEQANEQLRIAQDQIDDLTQRLEQSGEEISSLHMELLQWDNTMFDSDEPLFT